MSMARFLGKKSHVNSHRNKLNRLKKSIEFYNRSEISIEKFHRLAKMNMPLHPAVVLSAIGGLAIAHEATFFYKRLASLLSHKWGDDYSSVMGCSLSFSLLRSAIQCIKFVVLAPPSATMFPLLHRWI